MEAALFLVLFVVSLLLPVWVFVDAQENSPHNAFLWALVVFFAGLIGVLLYLILGRGGQRGGRNSGRGGGGLDNRRRPR